MKIQRLLIILFYLSSHERVRVEELCDLLEVSKRTVYRDLEILRTAGVEIESFTGMKGGLSLSKDFNMDRVLLDKNEWQSLIFNSLCMGQFNETRFSKEAKELYLKLTNLFQSEADEKHKKILFDMSYKFQGDELMKKIQWFEESIDSNQLVKVSYNSPFCKHLSTNGYVAPYGLVNKVGFWYLVGYCYIHQMYRAFNLAYIDNYEETAIDFPSDKEFNMMEFWEKSNPK